MKYFKLYENFRYENTDSDVFLLKQNDKEEFTHFCLIEHGTLSNPNKLGEWEELGPSMKTWDDIRDSHPRYRYEIEEIDESEATLLLA
jgi:hypothetical protein